ncbi:hypothetical protein MJM99_32090, partial [Salmonella enterica subsp. enterica serovar Kentucky]|nr:hypothetical protein [Salmonella enterica subsp. enterica serovar Kentucky]
LSDIEVPCSVLECEGEPCLFVNRQDEFAATCRLKNFGVAIAELKAMRFFVCRPSVISSVPAPRCQSEG